MRFPISFIPKLIYSSSLNDVYLFNCIQYRAHSNHCSTHLQSYAVAAIKTTAAAAAILQLVNEIHSHVICQFTAIVRLNAIRIYIRKEERGYSVYVSFFVYVLVREIKTEKFL